MNAFQRKMIPVMIMVEFTWQTFPNADQPVEKMSFSFKNILQFLLDIPHVNEHLRVLIMLAFMDELKLSKYIAVIKA